MDLGKVVRDAARKRNLCTDVSLQAVRHPHDSLNFSMYGGVLSQVANRLVDVLNSSEENHVENGISY